jgi:hypothetical protein
MEITSGQVESLIGKVTHEYSKAGRAVAEIMRDWWNNGVPAQAIPVKASTATAATAATEFDPPFDERGKHVEPVIATERATVHVSEVAHYPDPAAILLPAVEQMKLRARYAPAVRRGAVPEILDARLACVNAGVRLELKPDDPTRESEVLVGVPTLKAGGGGEQ